MRIFRLPHLGRLGQTDSEKSIRVVDRVTKKPIPGVEFKMFAMPDELASGRTDEKGEARISIKAPKWTPFSILLFGKGGYQEKRWTGSTGSPGEDPSVIELVSSDDSGAVASMASITPTTIALAAGFLVVLGAGAYFLLKKK